MVSMVASETNEREREGERQSSLSISPQPMKAVVSPLAPRRSGQAL